MLDVIRRYREIEIRLRQISIPGQNWIGVGGSDDIPNGWSSQARIILNQEGAPLQKVVEALKKQVMRPAEYDHLVVVEGKLHCQGREQVRIHFDHIMEAVAQVIT